MLKESPISSPDPITSPAILTPSLILPPSLLFDPDISLFLKNYYHLRSKSVPHLLPQLRYLIHPGINLMPPKRTSTSETPAITLDAIRKLFADFTTTLEAQTAAMASASNLTGTPAVKTGNYKEFISC
ncbi:hypothetical protein Tco_0404799 [Tanacetum coccineum]